MMTTKGSNKYKRIQILLSMAVIGAIAFSIYLINTNNKHFRSSIEEKEQASLLVIAKGSAFQIAEYLDRRRDRLVYLAHNPSIIKAIKRKKATSEDVKYIQSGALRDQTDIYLIDCKGTILNLYGNKYLDTDVIKPVCDSNLLTRLYPLDVGGVLLMQQPVVSNGVIIGAVGMPISLNSISSRFVEPSFVEFDGNMQVIDNNGLAVVHPETNVLGRNVVSYRQELYPDFDWTGYAEIIKRMRMEEGAGLYSSVRTSDSGIVPSRKIAAFSKVPFDGVIWSVLAVSDYDQILEPIISNNTYTAFLYAMVFGLFLTGGMGYLLYTRQTARADELEDKVAERTSALSLAMESLNSDIHKRMEVEERFRLLFTHSADAILIMDADTGALYGINPVGMSLFRMNHDECSKDELDGILPEPVLGFINRQLGKSGYLEVFDAQLSYMEGDDEVTLLAGAVTRPVAGSRVVYFSFNNITDRIRVEKESAIRLQHLIQADKMTALGTLVSGVAHEINNPNAFIMTNASVLSRVWRDVEQLLDRHKLDGETELGGLPYSEVRSEVPNLLAGMIDGSNRIKRIVASLKDFARKDDSAGKYPLNLNNVITDATVILGNRLKRLNDNFHMSLSEALPQVTGNPQQLEQVVINLIMNSLDALDGGGSIWVETSYDSKSRMVKLVVRDDGAGMSEEAIRRAPEPFYTTKQSSGGTGLGLYISFNILREHGAELSFSSALGSGTMATVLMPAG